MSLYDGAQSTLEPGDVQKTLEAIGRGAIVGSLVGKVKEWDPESSLTI